MLSPPIRQAGWRGRAGGECKNAVGELQLVRWRGGGWMGKVEGRWWGAERRWVTGGAR